MDPVDRITVGALGEPGARLFLLQARMGHELITLVLEKMEALALGRGSYELLVAIGSADLAAAFIGEEGYATQAGPLPEDMALEEDDPAWRIDSMGLGFDEEKDMAVIICNEMVGEDEIEEPVSARFFLSREQLAALGVQAMAVVSQGRPTCPMCGLIMESAEHVCPAVNGHDPSKHDSEDPDEEG